jgi:hypothetical protein
MGQNLILNAADHGVNVIAFNRTVSKVDNFLANEAKGRQILSRPDPSLQENTNYGSIIQASQSKVLTPSRSSAPSLRNPAA